jgi:predicted DNA-binding protein (MmcQ/YjbR family)
MNYDQAKKTLLSKPEAFEDFPFGPEVAVIKIKDKMFATLGLDTTGMYDHLLQNAAQKPLACMNLKCDPDQALGLRDIFPAVLPGYHMNKAHWNTIVLNSSIPVSEIERMIDHSYGLVVKSLKAAQRKSLELQYGPEKLYR